MRVVLPRGMFLECDQTRKQCYAIVYYLMQHTDDDGQTCKQTMKTTSTSNVLGMTD